MTDKSYSREVIDLKFDKVHERFDVQDTALAEILRQTKATNGKVRKIIIAIFLMLGFALGYMGQDALPTLLKLFVL